MADIFAIRNVDKKTKEFIYEYAYENHLNIGQALEEIIVLVKQHLKEPKIKKRKQSIFNIYDKIAFKSNDPNLSKNIDKYLYGKK